MLTDTAMAVQADFDYLITVSKLVLVGCLEFNFSFVPNRTLDCVIVMSCIAVSGLCMWQTEYDSLLGRVNSVFLVSCVSGEPETKKAASDRELNLSYHRLSADAAEFSLLESFTRLIWLQFPLPLRNIIHFIDKDSPLLF